MQDFFAHETATIDDGCRIGAGTKIWHYSHIMSILHLSPSTHPDMI